MGYHETCHDKECHAYERKQHVYNDTPRKIFVMPNAEEHNMFVGLLVCPFSSLSSLVFIAGAVEYCQKVRNTLVIARTREWCHSHVNSIVAINIIEYTEFFISAVAAAE